MHDTSTDKSTLLRIQLNERVGGSQWREPLVQRTSAMPMVRVRRIGAKMGRVAQSEINSGNNFFHISRHANTRRYPSAEERIAPIGPR
jgi:hypothetical protein